MSGQEVKLVLNINTPKYFQSTTHHTAVKRPLENSFASISSKKPKSLKFSGKAFRPSSKLSKLKLASSITNINNNYNDIIKKTNTIKKIENVPPANLGSSKVSFDSNVKVFPIDNKKPTSKLLNPSYLNSESQSQHGKQSNESASSDKPIISSLFSKNPDIPTLEEADIKPCLNEVFSNVSFNQLRISPKLISTVEKFGYTSMTTVQHLSIPIILEGNDVLIKSQTGSGKTLTYALPIVNDLMMREIKVKRIQGLLALIVVPTRELAIQTFTLLEKLCKACVWVVPGYLMGGEKKKAEKARLRKGINILVSTPGRLMDHINNTNSLSLSQVKYLVLDEADCMLEMGYEKSVTCIIDSLNREQNAAERQTMLLSATLTTAVEKLAGMSLNSPKVIDVTKETVDCEGAMADGSLVTPKNLTNHFMLVPTKLRLVSLAAFIIQKCKFSEEKKMLIFMTTQDMVDYHTGLFSKVLSSVGRSRKKVSGLELRAQRVLSGLEDGLDSDDEDEHIDQDREGDIHFMKLHGNMTQPERTAVFKGFHQATSGVLLCTDVASRGLDLPKVDWIVQFNPACNASDYVHRVGRTARANMVGSAVVFVTPAESGYISMLKNQGISFTELRMESVLNDLSHSSLYDRETEKLPQNMEVAATRFQDKFEQAVESDEDIRALATQGYVSFIRSYAAIPKAAREHFCFSLLHLGHCAKSFALRDPPGVLGAKGFKRFNKGEAKSYRVVKSSRSERESDRSQLLMQPKKVISEFDSGLDGLDDANKGGKKFKKAKKWKK